MRKEIIINSALNEIRIAMTEDGSLAELFIESPDNERSVGNIYLGRVTKVIQGINAAFINIGIHQDAFLHFSDVDETLENLYTDDDEETEETDEESSESTELEKSQNVDVKCPICGSETTLRTAKKGPNAGKKFHVCINYPHCEGKVVLDEEWGTDWE